MDIAKLKEYLGMLVELEKDKYSQETMIADLEEDIVSYQDEYNENETIIKSWSSAEKKVDTNKIEVKKNDKWVMILIVYVLCAFGGSIAWVLGRVITGSEILAIIIGVATVVLICMLGVSMWKSKLKKRKKQAIAQEQRQLRIKNDKGQEIANKCLKTNKNISNAIIPNLKKEKTVLLETLEMTKQALSKCYEIDIIPPKYRSLIPVCMFYDYVTNGRTYSIVRDPANYDEGAINIYEQECLQRTIINKLDEVIDSIDNLASTQRALCNVIQESSRETHRLLESIDNNITSTNETLQTIQYQNEQRNRCLEYMTYMDVHKFYN